MKFTNPLGLFLAGIAAVSAYQVAVAQIDPAQKGLPALIQVAAGNTMVLEVFAEGTIDYECKKEKEPLTTYKWITTSARAVLQDDKGNKLGEYGGTPSKWTFNDGSFVSGSQVAVSPNGDKNIPYQLVKADVAGGQGLLTTVSYVQRVNTKAGVAPSRKCTSGNEGDKVKVDYKAQYRFWKAN